MKTFQLALAVISVAIAACYAPAATAPPPSPPPSGSIPSPGTSSLKAVGASDLVALGQRTGVPIDPAAGRARFEAHRRQFLESRNARLRAANALEERKYASLVAGGGFKAALKTETAALQRELPTASPHTREKILAQLRNIPKYDMCGGAPVIADAPKSTTPSAIMMITGCQFGSASGEVHLVGNFPGGFLKLFVFVTDADSGWSDGAIKVSVPNIAGVADQPATLVVVRADGTTSDSVPVDFVATRDMDFLRRPLLQGECQGGTDDDHCYGTDEFQNSFVGHHWSDCCFNGVSGTDHFWATLKNGWVLSDVPIMDSEAGYTSCIAVFDNDPGRVVSVTGTAPGSPVVDLNVKWWVDGRCSGIQYLGAIYVTGPVGIAYQ